jgi:hypothetical protein
MIIVMQPGATQEQIQDVEERLRQFWVRHPSHLWRERTVIAPSARLN